ncbi:MULTISPECIES: hypothetical protein [unclassified Leucobacter]|uniref:hypothetical protein n=1 Tax=unclassified Leucobacter TaxID=2621730 RepID=UPI00165E5ADE|nr:MULTISPECIES: hypothetical protein [unclassified Leucobacter]MBC9926462.1 hypothetical protein [Leucobacter sp. cx-169]
MGIFDFIARSFGGLHSLSHAELKVEREALRQRYVSSENVGEASNLYDELKRYNEEMTRRANEAYALEHPEPQETRHREHGWYLSNDD